MKHFTITFATILFTLLSYGQEVPIIYPGSTEFNAAAFKNFEAIYDQGGFEMTVKFNKSKGVNPVFTAFMIMPDPSNPTRMGVDIIGHYAKDMSFAYRKFTYGKYQNEYIHADQINDTLNVSRMNISDVKYPTKKISLPIREKFIDGTMAFWFLAGLPLKEGYGARFYRWDIGENDVDFVDTLPFIVRGSKKTIKVNDISYECWPVEAKLSNGMILRTYVSKKEPYLILQEAIPPKGDVIPFVQLKRIIN